MLARPSSGCSCECGARLSASQGGIWGGSPSLLWCHCPLGPAGRRAGSGVSSVAVCTPSVSAPAAQPPAPLPWLCSIAVPDPPQGKAALFQPSSPKSQAGAVQRAPGSCARGRAGQRGTPGWRGSQRKEAAASLGGDRTKSGGSPAQAEQRQRLVPVRGRGTGAGRGAARASRDRLGRRGPGQVGKGCHQQQDSRGAGGWAQGKGWVGARLAGKGGMGRAKPEPEQRALG